MQKTAAATGIAREFKDIFELGGVPAFARFYREGVFVWKQLYKGFYRDWHMVPAPTIESPGATRQLYRLNAPKAVCAELAGLVWGEQAEVRVSSRQPVASGEDPLDEFVQHVLRANAFGEKLQQLIEQGLALGGAAIKVWAEPISEGTGNRVQGTGMAGDRIATSSPLTRGRLAMTCRG